MGQSSGKALALIYAKVTNADPGLLAAVDSGVAQRRELLNYLELHLEELRPYAG